MVAAVAAALVSGSSEMVQPESAPARMLGGEDCADVALPFIVLCHGVSLVAVEMGGILASGGVGV